jgi:type I restriction enzyme R subunit
VEHAIRHHLEVELNDDPDLQASFAEALARIFQEFRNNWKKIHEELEKLRQRIINARKEPTYGLHRKKQMPFFRTLKREIFGASEAVGLQQIPQIADSQSTFDALSEEDKISLLVDLTQQVTLIIERELKLTGFWESIPARNRLKADIQKILLQPAFIRLPNLLQNRAQIISRVMEIAEQNNDIILYAE